MNCFWIIRNWKFEIYEKYEDSFEDFKQLWTNYYWWYPDRAMAIKYTGWDRVDNWLRIVDQYYNL